MKCKKIMIALTAAAALTAAGCGKSASTDTEVTPTPVPTAVPSTGYNKSAADFNTGTEADRREDKHSEICIYYQQHER